MIRSLMAALLAFLVTGCIGDGFVHAKLEGKHIQDGIPATRVQDGWAISFDRFDVRLLSVEVLNPSGDVFAGGELDPATGTHNLASSAAVDGYELFSDSTGGDPFDSYSFRIAPTSAVTRSFLITGSAVKGTDQKHFAWGFKTDTRYSDCPVGPSFGNVALVVVDGEAMFQDAQGEVSFDAFAGADADADGMITEAELRAVSVGTGSWWTVLEERTSQLGRADGDVKCGTVQQVPVP